MIIISSQFNYTLYYQLVANVASLSSLSVLFYICSSADEPSGNDSVRNEGPICHNVCCVTKFIYLGFLSSCHLI